MKGLFLKIYDLITEPLYRRLSRELSLQSQIMAKGQLDYQERTASKMVDELLRLNLIVQNQIGQGRIEYGQGLPDELVPDYSSVADTDVEAVVKDIHDTMGAIEICNKHKLPLAAVLDIKSRYQDMSLSSIQRARNLEHEKEELLKMLVDLKQENQRLRSQSEISDKN
jgi:hypothetical protein